MSYVTALHLILYKIKMIINFKYIINDSTHSYLSSIYEARFIYE